MICLSIATTVCGLAFLFGGAFGIACYVQDLYDGTERPHGYFAVPIGIGAMMLGLGALLRAWL